MQEFNMIDELGVVKKESDSEIDEYEGFDAPQNVVLLEPIVNGSYPTMNTLRETLETVSFDFNIQLSWKFMWNALIQIKG